MLPRPVLAVALGLTLVALAGLAAAQGPGGAQVDGRLEPFEAPASQTTRDINALYYLILPISIVIGVLVEAFLLYTIVRYRGRPGKVLDSGEAERGHHKLEIAWTIPPAVILLMVGVLSAQTLGAIEQGPQADFTVGVIASQWVWNFEYPDGSVSTNVLAVEADRVVNLTVTATDVIHSLAIPSVGVKIDAIPGRTNHYWFRAETPGDYQVQCMEYCAGAHAYMRGKLEVVPRGSTQNGWVPPAGAGVENCDRATGVDRIVPIDLLETGGDPWSVRPPTFTANSAETLCVRVVNPAGQGAPHNLTFIQGTSGPKVAAWDPSLLPGREGAIVHQFDPGTYTYYCAVPGHRQLGMEGTLTVA